MNPTSSKHCLLASRLLQLRRTHSFTMPSLRHIDSAIDLHSLDPTRAWVEDIPPLRHVDSGIDLQPPDPTRDWVEDIQNSPHGSASFTFILGRDHISLEVDPTMTRGYSEPLDELMNGEDSPSAARGRARLTNVDVETFKAFVSFVGRGNYDPGVGVTHLVLGDLADMNLWQNSEAWDYGEISRVGMTRTLTGRVSMTDDDDTPIDEVSDNRKGISDCGREGPLRIGRLWLQETWSAPSAA
jgi:hypothetical protein